MVSSFDVGTPPPARPSPRGRRRCRQQGFRPRDWPSRPASPPRPAASGDFHPGPVRVVHFHAYRSRSLRRRTVDGDDELRRAHRGAARPADPGPARPVRRRRRRVHPAARHRHAGHEEDGGPGQGGPRRVLHAGVRQEGRGRPRPRRPRPPTLQARSRAETFVGRAQGDRSRSSSSPSRNRSRARRSSSRSSSSRRA